ncbi:vWF type A domain protein [Lacipirellula parvula]|uniref:VWF type A domain protein n=2 Tax=Lacipirellula parvula TaxID=2650471 RepID=A0A5K7X4C0_9BACT|nr:vWF type A domain protein [Lacipirellula parvula]
MNDRMHQSDQPAPDREELRDRLLDVALRERLGGETPPDLSATILQRAAADLVSLSPTEQEKTMANDSSRSRSRFWQSLALAATIVIAIGFLIEAAMVDSMRVARRPDRPDEAATEDLAVDLDGPVRQGTFATEGASFTGKNPESGSQQNGAANRDRSEYFLSDNVQHEPPDNQFALGEQAASTGEQKYLNTRETSAERSPPLTEFRNDRYASQPTAQSGRVAGQLPTSSPSSPANTLSNSLPFEKSGTGRVYNGPTPLRLWHNTRGAEQNTHVAVPTSSPSAEAIRLAMLQEKLAQLDADLQSKLSASRDPNSSEIRRLKTTVRVINNQIQHIENKRGMVLGMEMGRDQYARITENPFLPVSAANTDNRLSTFSIDIDTASYANVRQFLMQSHRLPPPDAVRIEELVNYFDYDYTPPTGDVPFAANVEVAGCPWAPEHRLVRVGIKGREIERTGRPLSNLVFLIDVSGSMNEPNKLPLLVAGMKQLTRQLGENDRVAIVVYASSEGLALDSTPGTDQSKILAALDQLQAGGSTAGGAGIQLAYQVAQQNFIKGAVNRVILCTDGDFNVGVTSPADLERMAETNAKETGVFLTVLGFGRGNLNDAMMEQVADKGNGNYHYIDTDREARKVLVEEMTGTLVTIAKDVKIQVEFNPAKVAGYRLIGYENRVLAAEDFNDDKKDAGEIGAGHTVTALYEIVPVGQPVAATAVDDLKYAPKVSEETKPAAEGGASGEDAAADEPASDELLTLKIRYKAPDGDQSTKLEFPIVDNGQTFAAASEDFKFASAVASFAMLLRNSEFKGNATYAAVAEIAAASQGNDPHEYRQEFVDMVERAKQLAGE